MLLLTEEFLFLDTPMNKKNCKPSSRSAENANQSNANKKMQMIEKAMNGGKMPTRSGKNYKGR